MPKFKEFLIKEEFGLGNLGNKLEKFYNDPDLGNRIAGAFVTSQWNNTSTTPWRGEGSLQNVHIPVDFVIPKIVKTGIIECIKNKQNPIYIRLSDGTECNFIDFKNVQGTPALGKVMTVVFQRNPQDLTNNFSKIQKAIVAE